MTAEKRRSRLNLSQREIALSQQVCPNSAKNTISLRLYLPNQAPELVKEAADTVLDSGDIFAASLCRAEQEWELSYGERKVSQCRIEEERPAELAEAYMEGLDKSPLDFPSCLYQAEVLPFSEGGVCLYVRFHHIIIDGYGMSLFVQRTLDVLEGKEISGSVFGEEGDVRETDVSEKAVSEKRASERSFWKSYFSGAEFEPAVFPGKAAGEEFKSRRVSVPKPLMKQAEAFAEKEGISVPYLFAAAFGFYLAQAAGKKDGVFLMPRLNRTEGQRRILGCYTLLVPVRVSIEETDTFPELCRSLQHAAKEASAHKELGFEQILSALREADAAGESLSEYVFNFYRFSFQTKLTYRVRFSVAGAMQNHMTFNLFYNEKGGLDLQFDYRKGIYTEESTDYLRDALFRILSEGMQTEEERKPLSRQSIVGKAEELDVTSVTGKTIPIPEDLTIPSLFRRAAAQYPERPAVYAGEHMFTFAELDAASDRIAWGLRRLGIGRGDCVAFLLKRDYRLIPTILGISKTGAAFIPVDPAYPMDRISYIMENSKASLLISSKNVEIAEKYDYMEADTLLSQEPGAGSLPEPMQGDLAYMIYTSGTTGRPKGVMLSHRGIANIVHPDNNPFNRDITENCRGIVAIGSICFDISLFELFVPLMNGLFVELGSERAMLDAGELAAHILRHNADILHVTPSRITAYLSNRDFCEALGQVKAILAAGEVLPGSLAKRLNDDYHIRIYNGYGPTETTIGATITEAGDTTSIGTPIANMGVVLLNRQGRLVPFGAVGEICVHGNGVGIGYKDRPKETEEKYIIWNGKRLYRTGDLGYFSQDGRVMYCGRNDRQVKLRGLRIELSEIENVMGSFPGVAACCCIIRNMEKIRRLVGFYTVAEGSLVESEKLKQHLKSRLTSYMVPDILKELASMPQTPNGKTDSKALEAEPITYHRVYKEPETEREKLLCGVLREILELPRVGLEDNFFESGGDSLKAALAVLKIQEALGLEEDTLEFGDFYQCPTPALLLEKIDRKQKGSRPEEESRKEEFDLSVLDYRGIPEYLSAHTKRDTGQRSLGNVLLTGVTGYLGIHIFIELLEHPHLYDKMICLSRPKRKLTAEKRVKSSLFYYAERDFSESYQEKWLVAEGDLTNPDIFAGPCPFPIDTIINSAADVSHFSYGDSLENINTNGVKNLIRFAQKEHATLCQISTISVAGLMEKETAFLKGRSGTADGPGPEGFVPECFRESDFYIGQKIRNKYIYSKYMAEYEMLRASVDSGLKIKIFRVGNLQGRIRDGEFQMNFHSNGFARQFSSYVKLKAAPRPVYEGSVNFSPVDETARNIVSLAALIEEAAIFHVCPPTELKFARLFRGVQKLGYTVDILPETEFFALLRERRKTNEGRLQLQGLITNEDTRAFWEIPVSQELTNWYIRELSGGWSAITEEYIDKYLSALDGMDLF